MDCRAFRKKHLAFVDDTLPGVDIVQMQAHITACARCAQTDLAVRRSLLVVRNHLSPIEPSSDFSERLSARLERERYNLSGTSPLFGSTSWTGFAAMCGGVIAVGVLAIAMGEPPAAAMGTRLPVVVLEATPATPGQYDPMPDATPAFVATVSTGMAILPALLLAEEVPFRTTANTEGEAALVSPAGLTRIVPDIR
jgi:hypothetical protein